MGRVRFPNGVARTAHDVIRIPTDEEQQVNRTSAFAAAIVAYTDDAIIAKSLDGTVLSWNSSAQRIFGYSAAEMIGEPIFRLFPADRLHEEAELVEQVLNDQDMSQFETQRVRKDGWLIDVSVTLSLVRDASGKVVAISKIARDITDRKLAEQALADSVARFQQLYEATPAMMHSIDTQGRLLSVSDRWLKHLGYSREEVLGRALTDFLTVASQAIFQTDHLGAFRQGRNDVCLDYQMVSKNGQVIDVVLSAVAEQDTQEHFAKGMAVVEDVTARKTAERALRVSEEFLDRAGRIAGIGDWSFDLETQIIRWSDQTCRIQEVELGHQPTLAEALGYYTPESRVILERAIDHCIQTGDIYDLELTLVTAKGRPLWVRAVGEAETQNGKAIRMFGSLQDITARRIVEIRLAEQHELMRVTLHSIGDGVITTDVNGVVQWLNPVATRLTGWLIDEALGCPIDQVFKIVDEINHLPALSPVTRALAEDQPVGLPEYTVLIARDGAQHGIEDSAAPIRNTAGSVVGTVLVFHDVSEQRRLAKEVNHRVSHDELTGLINRAEFEVRLQNALNSAHDDQGSHALMFIDLDQFKLVNDACGHAVGDQLLRQVSVLFKNVVRSRDTLARLGGDEFGVIMDHCTVTQAQRVAGQLCEIMENFRFVHEDRRFRIGASVGLVPLDNRWTDTTLLMQAADASCYAAKEGGRNRVHEWVDTDERMKERRGELQWVTRLEEALDDNRFLLFGQRIASCSATTAGLSLEVLLRLANSDGTMIGPAAFLPAAERFHMASRIDRWVVREVLDWMGQIPLEGVDTIAINLSGQSIGDRSFHRYLIDLISRIPFDPRKLCFEITETAAITNLGDAGEFIKAIRALGVRIALDDFGSGASSFGYLKHLAVDILKIDGQFVRDLLKDPLDHTAVRCFRDVAEVCGLQTVAEFVENGEIFAELRQIGVDFAQGYLIHRPEPLEHLLPARPTASAKQAHNIAPVVHAAP